MPRSQTPVRVPSRLTLEHSVLRKIAFTGVGVAAGILAVGTFLIHYVDHDIDFFFIGLAILFVTFVVGLFKIFASTLPNTT